MTRGWSVALALLLGAACTKSNPAATCADGTCTDPAFPFCDVSGEISGAPGTCVAVTCDAGSIGGCQGSAELVCSANGDTYVTKACANGCDPIAGCLACAPNQSVCTTDGNFQSCDANGSATTVVCPHVCDASVGCLDCQPSSLTCTADGSAVQTCTGSGTVASTDACALACGSDGSDGAHCTQLVPSNGLQMYLDMVPNPPDVTLVNGGLFLGSDSAEFLDGSNDTMLSVFQVAAPAGGAPLTVIVGNHVTLGQIGIENSDSTVPGGLNSGVGRAVVFLATSDLEVTGYISVVSGAVSISGCNGGAQNVDSSGSQPHTSGGGGGGNATNGADGGSVGAGALGAAHGTAAGSDDLVPLKGGCPGGLAGQLFGGNGGGAIQLVSLTTIRIEAPVDADGGVGGGGGGSGAGGGGGGGILLEAPTVSLEGSAALLARGGGGFSGCGDGGTISVDDSPIPGGSSGSNEIARCGNGGRGGTFTILPTVGGPPTSPSPNVADYAGGGGGGVGRIRINTADGTFTQASGAVIAGRLTTGVAATK